jgi:hypothetical protein
MKQVRYLLLGFLMVLAACSQAPSPEANRDEELSSQAVLPGASGKLYYAAHNPTAADPYRIFRQDQTNGNPVLVYSGVKEIQSVAGTLDGSTVIMSMRETSSSSSDFEIYRITSTTTATQLTTNSFDDTNVSISRGSTQLGLFAYTMAWETQVSCNISQGCNTKRAIRVRSTNGLSSSDSIVSFGSGDLTQPTLSGNGQYVAYIRKTSSNDRVDLYKFSPSTNTTIATNGSGLIKPSFSDPSVSDDGTKVVYLSKLFIFPNTSYRIRLNTSGVTTTIVSGVPMSHPHLTADGNWLTYAKQVNGAYRIVTRSLVTNFEVDSTAPVAPRNHYAPFWQK